MQIKTIKPICPFYAVAKQAALAATVGMLWLGAGLITTAQAAVAFQKLVVYGQERPDKDDPDSEGVQEA